MRIGPGLSQAVARARADALTVHRYAVDLDLTTRGEYFVSTSHVTFGWRSPDGVAASDCLRIDVAKARLRSVILNGRALPAGAARVADGLRIVPMPGDNEIVVTAEFPYSTSAQGLHRHRDAAGGIHIYGHLQVPYAKRVFACFDQPDLKAPFEITMRTPAGWSAISTAPLASRHLSGGVAVNRFAATPPLSTYTLALVAGDYTRWTDTHHGIQLGLACRPAMRANVDATAWFDLVKRGIDCYRELFGVTYPFRQFEVCFAPEYASRAMENAGCILMGEGFIAQPCPSAAARHLRALTLLHEMSHMWFGNLVTLRWWDELWLNEAFATWAGRVAGERVLDGSGASLAAGDLSDAFGRDRMPSAHPVWQPVSVDEEADAAFDSLTYEKGARMVRQLAARAGGAVPFGAALGDYLRRHAFSNATLPDLLRAVGDRCGVNLTGWAEDWLLTTGVNVVRPEFTIGPDGRYTSFAIVQEAAHGSVRAGRQRVGLGLHDERHRYVEVDIDGPTTPVSELVGEAAAALVLLNDGEHAYCIARLPHETLDGLPGLLATQADPTVRAACWAAAWEAMRDGDMAPTRFIALATAALATEREVGLVVRLTGYVQQTASVYLDPAPSGPHWDRYARMLWEAITREEAHPERQHVYLSALCAAVLSPEHLCAMRGWLAGVDPPTALDRDPLLRWRVVQALAAHGDSSETSLAWEDADPTLRSAISRAAAFVPTFENKVACWRRLFDPALDGGALAGLSKGLLHPAHPALNVRVAELVLAAPAAWTNIPHGRARLVFQHLIPNLPASAALVRRYTELLSEDGLPEAVRGYLADGRAHARTVLRVRGTT